MPHTAAGSRMLADFRPPYQAEAVDRLLGAGYALAGHANIDEFGIGGSTESSYFGPTLNPLAPGHICSGAAAAAAQGIVGAALIADAGGAAIRQAAFAGCAGYRPSYGMVSRYGLIAYVNSCEQIGGLARDIDSAAALVQAVAGHDAKDATSLPQQGYDLSGGHDPAGLRIALLEPEPEPAPEIGDMLAQAAHKLARAGARVDKVRLPEADYAAAAFMIIAAAEGCTNISRFDGVKYGYRAADYRSIEELYRRSRSQASQASVQPLAVPGSPRARPSPWRPSG